MNTDDIDVCNTRNLAYPFDQIPSRRFIGRFQRGWQFDSVGFTEFDFGSRIDRPTDVRNRTSGWFDRNDDSTDHGKSTVSFAGFVSFFRIEGGDPLS